MSFVRSIFLSLFLIVLKSFGADTLKLVGVMVEFQEDDFSDETTGTGQFGSDPSGEKFILDPLPHKEPYFVSHLRFAHNYLKTVSKGQFYLDYAVFWIPSIPKIGGPLILPSKMKHYRVPRKEPRESFDEFNLRLNQGIMSLAGDALKTIAATGILDIGSTVARPGGNGDLRVDSSTVFLIFHAGRFRAYRRRGTGCVRRRYAKRSGAQLHLA